mmetsp:Transcript_92964/g.203502  ORF Transcript_92964/g.203502 Transcript_92964/m.203502 type:complete len:334 (-) Transcript_92964:220-1221(-)
MLFVAAAGVSSETWPVPCSIGLFQLPAVMVLPLLALVCPIELLQSRTFQKRLVGSAALLVTLAAMAWTLCLLSMVLRGSQDSLPKQLLIVLGFFIMKLTLLRIDSFASWHLGTDGVPIFIFLTVFSYQLAFYTAVVRGLKWPSFAILLAIDLLENILQTYRLEHRRQQVAQSHSDSPTQTVSREVLELEHFTQAHDVASLILRQFAQLSVLICYFLQVALTRHFASQYSDLICQQTDSEMKTMVMQFGVVLLVEATALSWSWGLMSYRGYHPASWLRGLTACYLPSFLAAASSMYMYSWCFQHSHFGNDASFDFEWASGAEMDWVCGLRYVKV